jgi:hypothetical protein
MEGYRQKSIFQVGFWHIHLKKCVKIHIIHWKKCVGMSEGLSLPHVEGGVGKMINIV